MGDNGAGQEMAEIFCFATHLLLLYNPAHTKMKALKMLLRCAPGGDGL